ncbi:MAG TPA: PEGA domain-containing protein [Polyangia bacterium]|jgi:hypothetical protein
MAHRSALAFLILFVVAGSTRATAAVPVPPTAAPVDATAKAEARERFDRGLGLFEKGENAAALAEFKRAFELIPNPVVLYNMGLVYAAMNRPVEATDALDRFLEGTKEKPASEQRRQAQKVRAEQAARIARLQVVTDHPASVEVDGVEAGRTPLGEPLRLVSGAHTITALAPGYQPSRREVTLAGQVTETVTMALLPTETATAHLVITTPLPGATVWLNDKLVGTTPLPASVAVPPGEVRVELRRDGYRTASRSLHVDVGASAKVDLTLDEDPAATSKGRLRLALAASASTEISVDGVPRTAVSDGIPLPAGPHILRIQSAGFEAYGMSVQIDAGRDTMLAVTLTPTLETRARDEEAVGSRHLLGGAILGGGLAVVGGATLYAILTRNDVSRAQAVLNGQLADEQDVNKQCYHGPGFMPGNYESNSCAARKSNDQDDVDSAKLKRVLAFSAIGAGAIIAGVGGYLLATTGTTRSAATPEKRLTLWTSDGGAGVMLFAPF